VGMQAHRRLGIAELKTALARAVGRTSPAEESLFPPAFEEEVARLQWIFTDEESAQPLPAFLLRRLLLDTSGYLEQRLAGGAGGARSDGLAAARQRLQDAGCPLPAVETTVRYAWVQRVLEGVLTEPTRYGMTVTDRIDRFLTHRWWGLLFFAAVMLIVFQSIFLGALPAMEAIETVTAAVGGWVEARMAEGALRSLLVGGVISGAGGVLAFLPQILVLFFFLGILEDCGYMARAAFLMDKLMSRIGLSGKSCIPMLSCFACSVPGIMAARVIENERDRLATILVSPLLTCSARLPIYALLIAAFIPMQTYFGGLLNLQGLTMAGLYLLGIVAAAAAALTLKKTLLRGQAFPFVMELPSYKWPSLRTVLQRMLQRGWIFLHTAGTLILAVSVLVWASLYYPHNPQTVAALQQQRQQLQQQFERLAPGDPHREPTEKRLRRLVHEIDSTYQRNSILGTLGRYIEPVVKPLGWDWRIGCAVIASFPAREVVVATLGVMYNVSDEADGDDANDYALKQRMRAATWDGTEEPVFNVPVSLSILVFFALCAQCAATLAVIRRETNSWRWPAFTFAYMTALAYVGALVTYQVGMWIGG